MSNIRSRLAYSFVAILLACNYFAFQVELFDGEYEANHPAPATMGTHSVSAPSLTWESFDKENAPEAFVLNSFPSIELAGYLPPADQNEHASNPQYQPIRDKSPPSSR